MSAWQIIKGTTNHSTSGCLLHHFWVLLRGFFTKTWVVVLVRKVILGLNVQGFLKVFLNTLFLVWTYEAMQQSFFSLLSSRAVPPALASFESAALCRIHTLEPRHTLAMYNEQSLPLTSRLGRNLFGSVLLSVELHSRYIAGVAGRTTAPFRFGGDSLGKGLLQSIS